MDADIGVGAKPNRKIEWDDILRKAIPYLVLLAASIVPFWFWIITDQITGGDDAYAQISWVYDLYYGFQHGFYFNSTNHLIFGYLGYNTYVFYGPLSHYMAAIVAYCFSGMGASVLGSMKFVSIASVFVSGVFTYWLAYRMSHNRALSLLAGIAFVLLPYRLFCFFYRFAFAEGVAISFMPMFFYGLYRILHDDKCYVAPYLCVVFGISCTVLCHPFTGLLTALAGVIFLLFNIKRIIKLFHKLRPFIYVLISLTLIGGLVFFFVVPMVQATGTDIYRVSDAEVMWATVDQVIGQLSKTSPFSGFLNYNWLETYGTNATATDTTFAWSMGLIVFVISTFGCFAVDTIIKWAFGKSRIKGIVPILVRIASSFLLTFLPSLLMYTRAETYFGLFLFYAFYVALFLFPNEKEPEGLGLKKKETNKEIAMELLKEPELYAFLFCVIIGMIYLYTDWIWKISPSVLYYGQFPFRFWAITGFMAILALVLIFRKWGRNKTVLASLAVLTALLFPLDQAIVDKRIWNYEEGHSYINEPSEAFVHSLTQQGVQNEYSASIFRDLYYGKATLTYPNSLGKQVANMIWKKNGFKYTIEDYLTPAFLEGSGTMDITELNTPNLSFDVTVTSEGGALVQIPAMYYEGYYASAIIDGTSIDAPVTMVDGLVTMSLPQGDSYVVKVGYHGTSTKRFGYVLLALSVTGAIGFGIYGWLDMKKRKSPKAIAFSGSSED